MTQTREVHMVNEKTQNTLTVFLLDCLCILGVEISSFITISASHILPGQMNTEQLWPRKQLGQSETWVHLVHFCTF